MLHRDVPIKQKMYVRYNKFSKNNPNGLTMFILAHTSRHNLFLFIIFL